MEDPTLLSHRRPKIARSTPESHSGVLGYESRGVEPKEEEKIHQRLVNEKLKAAVDWDAGHAHPRALIANQD